jgi:hypothetical protein
MVKTSNTDLVRQYSSEKYVEPARRRGDASFRIVAGDVQRAVGLSNRVPLVCQALKSHRFLDENDLILEKWEGPPSGLSTTVTFTYRFRHKEKDQAAPQSSLLQLRGIAKDIFRSLGGGEEFIRKEREQFYGSRSSSEKL